MYPGEVTPHFLKEVQLDSWGKVPISCHDHPGMLRIWNWTVNKWENDLSIRISGFVLYPRMVMHTSEKTNSFGVAATESLLKVVHDSLAQNRNSSCLLASKQKNTMQLQDLYFPTTILWNLEVLSRIMFITPFIDCYNQCVATCNNISCWVAAWSASFVRPCKCKELSVVEVLNMQMNPNKASIKTTNRMPHINVRNWAN